MKEFCGERSVRRYVVVQATLGVSQKEMIEKLIEGGYSKRHAQNLVKAYLYYFRNGWLEPH